MLIRFGLISGLLMTAVLGFPGGAQAATGSAHTAPSISPASCGPTNTFWLGLDHSGANGVMGGGGDLYFNTSGSLDYFCQVPVSPGSKNVVLFYKGPPPDPTNNSGECLALNATTDAIDLHSANGCVSHQPSYVQWRFIYASGSGYNKWYVLQSQFQTLRKPCLYDNIETDPAIYSSCNIRDSFELLQLYS